MFHKAKIGFDSNDPTQMLGLSILLAANRGKRGKILSHVITSYLTEHGFSGLLSTPSAAAAWLEATSRITADTRGVSPPVGVSPKPPAYVDRKVKKTPAKREKDATALPQSSVPAPQPEPASLHEPQIAQENPAPLTSELNDITTSGDFPDPKHPWRLPDGKMRILPDDVAESLIDTPAWKEYRNEVEDYMLAHPGELR